MTGTVTGTVDGTDVDVDPIPMAMVRVVNNLALSPSPRLVCLKLCAPSGRHPANNDAKVADDYDDYDVDDDDDDNFRFFRALCHAKRRLRKPPCNWSPHPGEVRLSFS